MQLQKSFSSFIITEMAPPLFERIAEECPIVKDKKCAPRKIFWHAGGLTDIITVIKSLLKKWEYARDMPNSFQNARFAISWILEKKSRK